MVFSVDRLLLYRVMQCQKHYAASFLSHTIPFSLFSAFPVCGKRFKSNKKKLLLINFNLLHGTHMYIRMNVFSHANAFE